MRMTMAALNAVLFEQIERINDDELKGEELDEQVLKSRTIKGIADVLLKSADIELRKRSLEERNGTDGRPLLAYKEADA